jgi:hypothetical protein
LTPCRTLRRSAQKQKAGSASALPASSTCRRDGQPGLHLTKSLPDLPDRPDQQDLTVQPARPAAPARPRPAACAALPAHPSSCRPGPGSGWSAAP